LNSHGDAQEQIRLLRILIERPVASEEAASPTARGERLDSWRLGRQPAPTAAP
jgi:hypothetical protein